MKHKLLLTLLSVLCSLAIAAQTHCSEIIRTTTPTVNVWDWRGRYWDVYYITTSGLPSYYLMDSPFYDVQNQNVLNLAQQNEENKDFKVEDGWELIKKDLGTSSQASRFPYVVLYNKYTARLRTFFLVTQLYSDVGTTDAQKGGLVTVGFVDGSQNTQYAYQSNVLAAYTAPILPLDQFKRDIEIRTPNLFRSTLPYWLYADVPVVYDPCTCASKGQLYIHAELMSTAQVDITIKSLPYQSPVKNDNVNANSDFLTGFSNFAGKVEGGVKAANSAGETVDKLVGSLDKVIDPDNDDLKYFYTEALQSLGYKSEVLGNWLDIIPVAYKATKAVVSLVDYFASGGKSSSTGAAPAPVMIMNDFKATGTISSTYPKNKVNFSIPGSDQSSINPDLIPVYNNPLGIFSLVETPVVKTKSYSVYGRYVGIYENFLYTTTTYQIYSTPEYVLNPALNIDWYLSDIKAAVIVAPLPQCLDPLRVSISSNLESEVNNQFRSSYYPISCVNRALLKVSYNWKGGWPPPSPPCDDFFAGVKVFLKVTARLKRRNSTNPNEDIVFIATYPTKLSSAGGGVYALNQPNPIPWNMEDYSEKVVIPDNTVYNTNTTLSSLGDITVGKNITLQNNATLTLVAAGSIIIPQGSALPPNVVMYPGSNEPITPCLGFGSSDIIKTPPLPPSQIATFCNSSVYKVNNRFIASRKSAEEDGAEESNSGADQISYAQPNPFKESTFIHYSLKERTPVSLIITDMTGRQVATLVDGQMLDAGKYAAEFKSANLPSGIYIYTLTTNTKRETKRLVVVK